MRLMRLYVDEYRLHDCVSYLTEMYYYEGTECTCYL